MLVPKLELGDVVVMDNLSSHKQGRTRVLIESGGASLVFLPPYSPDLNLIGMVFSKIKHFCVRWVSGRWMLFGEQCRLCSIR